MATLEEIRAARQADSGGSVLDQIRQARARDTASKTPDGRSVAPGTTKDQAANVPEGMIYDPQTGGYVDTSLAAQRMGKGQGANASFLAGVPFVGEYVDEAMGAADSAMTGRNPEIATETMRQSRQQFQESNPNSAAGLEFTGGVVGSIPMIAGGAGVVAKGGGLLQKTAIGAGLGAAGGATEGAISGYGAGTDAESRRSEAARRGTFGAVAGGALGVAAPAIGQFAKGAVRRIKKLDVATIADEFGTDRKTASIIKSYLVNDDLDAAARRLSEIGDDAMLADAGLGTGQALDTAMASGGRALRVGREAVETRANAAGQRMAKTLDDVLGEADGVKSAARNISQRTSAVRKRAYDVAYKSPINYASGAGRKIESVLERIPSGAMGRAVKEANEAMQADGLRNLQIMAEIADDGAVTFREMPNVQQLDYIKRALGDIAQRETDDMGRLTGAGIRANRLAGELRDAVGEAVPAYRRALKVGGDKIAEDNALRIGKDLLTRRVKLEDVRDTMRGASIEARQAAKRGLREGIEETLSNVRRTITDPNTDAREAMQLVKDMSSRANRGKLRLILGQSETDRLMSELDKTAAALELRSMVATNSKTAVRQAGQTAVEEATGRGTVGTLLEAKPVDALQKGIQELTGATDAATAARREEIFAQIAEALTRKRGSEAQRALVAVRNAMNGQPLNDEAAARVVREAGVPLVSSAYQSATQFLESQ